MSNAATIAAGRGKRLKWIVGLLLAVGVGLAVPAYWFAGANFSKNDRIFRGKPESEWIKNLKYSDEKQVEEWRTYGEEGVQVLIRGLERTNRPGERAYRRCHRRLPSFVAQWLPAPKPDITYGTRLRLVSLLASLGSDARGAVRIMSRTLEHDEAANLRAEAICFFISTQLDSFEKCWLDQLPADQRLALLPLFLRALRDNSSQVRFYAAVALRFYPEQAEVITPVLLGLLNDPASASYARLRIADTLHRINPEAASEANVVSVISPLLKDRDRSVAIGAAKFLGECTQDSDTAIAALFDGLDSTNGWAVFESVWSLVQFTNHRDTVFPALEMASNENENVRRAFSSARTRLEFEQRRKARLP